MKSQNMLKQAVARAAIEKVKPYFGRGTVLGIGTGSTVDFFIDELAHYRDEFSAAVASSNRSAERLKKYGIEVIDLNTVRDLPVYVDGADEITEHLVMIKGGGAALTREKIVAAVAQTFICIADVSKLVPVLGNFPLPIEVIPVARSYVARQLMKLSTEFPTVSVDVRWQAEGKPLLTDNGNVILDVRGLSIIDPVGLEARLNQIVGVVTNGLFAARSADVALLASGKGIQTLTK